jgi:hypothetical protein
LREGQFFVDRNPHSGKINLNFWGREKSDEDPQTGRKKRIGQEARGQKAGSTHRFWDALTGPFPVIILKAMGNGPMAFLFSGLLGNKK